MKRSIPPTPFMKLALRLAARGRGTTSPNPMVGAVLTKGGRVVGRGYHRRAGGPHAEVVALDHAGEAARGAALYVTLEPCRHQGKTGPCTERILEAGVAEVIVAMIDPFPEVSGRGIARLRRAGVRVHVGEGEEEARRMNEAYLFRLREGRPWVDLKLAATLDGKIADGRGRSQWITGERARRRGHDLRWGADAILVGVETVLRDNPRLTARKGGASRKPLRIILDSTLRTPPGAAMLREENDPARTIIACRSDAPTARRKRLERTGATLWTVPGLRSGGVSPAAVLRRLGGAGVGRVLVEGGGRVAGSFLSRGFVERLHYFMSSRVLGSGADSIRIVPALSLAGAIPLRPAGMRLHGDDLERILERDRGED